MANPFSGAGGLLVGGAIGAAAGAAFEPAFEVPRQDAWHNNPNRVLDVGLLAALVAQGGVLLGDPASIAKGTAYDEALRQGYTTDKLDRLIYLAQSAPDLALTLELWRRGLLGDPTGTKATGLVEHAFAKHQIEPQYWPALEELFSARVQPPTIAVAVQRGILENVQDPNGTDHLLTVTPDVSAATIDSPAQVPLDVLAEARAWGYDFDRLAVDARIAGIPPAPGELMQLLNRKLINDADFLLGIAEGDTRNEWAAVLEKLRFRVLSGVEAAELHVRGWVDQPTMYALGELDGWTNDRMDLLYDLRGRPLSLHQAFIADRRGGAYKGDTTGIPDWALAEMGQSNVRPEWFNMAWAQRQSLPSAFVVRSLLTDNAISESDGETLFLHMGWPEDLAHTVAVHYAGGSAGTADKHVAKAQTQLWTTTHRAYLNSKATDAEAATALTAAGVTPAAIPQVLALWQEERTIDRKTLSAAQIKKAWSEAVVNPDTGAAWTKDEALAALIEIGYNPSDAATFLEL